MALKLGSGDVCLVKTKGILGDTLPLAVWQGRSVGLTQGCFLSLPERLHLAHGLLGGGPQMSSLESFLRCWHLGSVA